MQLPPETFACALIHVGTPAKRLAELRVDFGQGYLFSRPVPAAELRKLLRHVGPLPTSPATLDF